ncbi:ComEA family DNA-binding protein [Nocardioides antri]|uniref:ComEA family DNA-binding protein n=1 Tax=Nocardioides antri TaxID=2607659 RepID=A0A5B1M269_9ACTN|nr:ComEA family DNA-binding protein [Nocardioides antri]KAA1426219.1 ComEA family DNA-binding protein [Nocardioides antri]
MRSTRGPSGGEPSREDRADAAARRLALLAADLGTTDPDPVERPWPPPEADDYTRVVPARRAVPALPEPVAAPEPAGPAAPTPPVVLPRPGRHAARRRLPVALPRVPVLGPAHLAVLALVVAAGIGVTAWLVVRDQAEPVGPAVAAPAQSVEPLVPAPGGADASASPAGTDDTVTVDVTGKVRRPGIVVLDVGARVVDALKAAGGRRPGVDLSTLNLARVLVDGEQIVVGGSPAAAPAVPSGSAPPGAPVTLVNLNTATQAELETLPDVGPVTAAAILAWRDEHGGFTSVDELLEVDGIGDVTLEKLSPHVTL